MSVLSAQSIRKALILQPFHERTVIAGMSYGLSAASYDVRIAESVRLLPGAFVLASTLERFKMPENIIGIVHDKSSWARRGIATQNTLIDPGWEGFLTLELTNHGKDIILITSGWPIAQIKFEWLDHYTSQPYKGKYQNQEPGAQPARIEKEFSY